MYLCSKYIIRIIYYIFLYSYIHVFIWICTYISIYIYNYIFTYVYMYCTRVHHYSLHSIRIRIIRYPHDIWNGGVSSLSPSKITILLFNTPTSISKPSHVSIGLSWFLCCPSPCEFLVGVSRSAVRDGGLSVAELQEGVIRLCSIKSWQGISRVSFWVENASNNCVEDWVR